MANSIVGGTHMLYDLVLRGKYVKDGVNQGDIGVKDGVIQAISESNQLEGKKTIEFKDELIYPGFIDSHVHAYSNPDEGMFRMTAAAAHGGVTTVLDMPYDRPHAINTEELLKNKIKDVNENANVDVALWATVAKNKGVYEVQKMIDLGAVAFKLSTYETDPVRFPGIPDNQIKEILSLATENGIVTAFHAENEQMIDELVEKFQKEGKTTPIYHNLSRPPESETTAVSKLLELAKVDNTKLHLVHISSPESVVLIELYKNKFNIDVTYETCYQYLTLNTDDLEKFGVLAKCNPALRTPDESKQLFSQLKDNKIDFITSDHAPWVKNKEEKNIFKEASGLTGLDIMIPIMHDFLVNSNEISSDKFSKLFSTNIAQRFNLAKKGKIAIGYDADFAVIHPNDSWILTEEDYESLSKQSVFNGTKINSKVVQTFVRGQSVYENDQLVNKQSGKFVEGSGVKHHA